ncbi:MAG: hypothetical protein N2109_02535 [Fimbriimonadales bacterium]|nr:hypothetical protein [Fimbriimonadales bacterium]
MRTMVIVTTCGTSLLTQGASNDDRASLTRWAHAERETDVDSAERETLLETLCRQAQRLEGADAAEARALSAELNGLLAYVGDLAAVRLHVLVHTDTLLGRWAAEAVQTWLQHRDPGAQVELRTFEGLQVRDQPRLDLALAEAARWVTDDLDWVRRDPGLRLVFHTTGGFKAVQGFFQTLGLLFADETVYLFEGAEGVVRIPRLPLKVDLGNLSAEQTTDLRRLRVGLPPIGSALPELLASGGKLSGYGRMLADRWWHDVADLELLPPISPLLRWGPDLENTFLEETRSGKRREANRKLEQLAYVLETGRDLAGVDLHRIHGDHGPYTHLVDAWHDGGARRFFLQQEAGGVFVVGKLAEKLGG